MSMPPVPTCLRPEEQGPYGGTGDQRRPRPSAPGVHAMCAVECGYDALLSTRSPSTLLAQSSATEGSSTTIGHLGIDQAAAPRIATLRGCTVA